jgi:hypothetical protein
VAKRERQIRPQARSERKGSHSMVAEGRKLHWGFLGV